MPLRRILLVSLIGALALPAAAAFTWARAGGSGGSRRHWIWLGAWAALLGLYSIPVTGRVWLSSSWRSSGMSSSGVEVNRQPGVSSRHRTVAVQGSEMLPMT